jgi:hypothetical protein
MPVHDVRPVAHRLRRHRFDDVAVVEDAIA